MCAPEPLAPLRAAFPRDTGQRHVPRGHCERLRREASPHFIFSSIPFLTPPPQPGPSRCVCARGGYRQPESLFPGRLPGESLPGGAGAGGRYPGRQRREPGLLPGKCGGCQAGLGPHPPPAAGLGRGRGVLPPRRGARAGFSERVFPVTLNALLGDCFPFPLVCLLLAS